MTVTFFAAVLFLATALGLVAAYNRFFEPVRLRVAFFFVIVVFLYLARAMLTTAVEVPTDLAFYAYPWKALATAHLRRANTGIVFTQLLPWTQAARRALFHGSLPLWNPTLGCGSPLLASQQTAIFHPFTLIGLLLPVGKALTLSIALRLFWTLFWSFVLFRHWSHSTLASLFGAVAYAFCVFQVVWLSFPLGLSCDALPALLVGAHEIFLRRSWPAFLLLTGAFAFAILGGHPESALWVGVASGIYALTLALGSTAIAARGAALATCLLAALVAASLTAFVWLPTIDILPLASRYQVHSSLVANPASHGITAEWLAPLFTPNIFGTPQEGSYESPPPRLLAVPSDYGEVATGYAGILALGMAIFALLSKRSRYHWYLLLLLVLSFLTIYEAPGWIDALRRVPLLGVSLTQRLRLLWSFAVAGLAVLGVADWLATDSSTDKVRRSLFAAGGLVGATYFFHWKFILGRGVAPHQLAWLGITTVTLAGGILAIARMKPGAAIPILLALNAAELLALTSGYNLAGPPGDLFPVTPAIRRMESSAVAPFRMTALGWSFLPDTPGFYGLEDIRTTDPLQLASYKLLLDDFLHIRRGDYNRQPRSLAEPFVNFLGVRYVYAPPNLNLSAIPGTSRLRVVYSGPDGRVLENADAMPRFFLARNARGAPDLREAVAAMRSISSFRDTTIVDRVPGWVPPSQPGSASTKPRDWSGAGGSIALRRYTPNERDLDIEARGWNLVVSSEVAWPGWRAYWNDRRVPLATVNGSFVGVFVPPGNGVLRLRYRPEIFDVGLRVALWALVLLLGGFVVTRRFRSNEGPHAPGSSLIASRSAIDFATTKVACDEPHDETNRSVRPVAHDEP